MLCVSLVASAASLAPGHRAAPGSCTLRASKQQTIQSLRRQVVARAEEGKSSGAPAAADTPNDEVAAEQLLRRRKGSKADSKAAGSGGSAKQQPPKVISAVRDQVYGGGPLTFEQQAENSVVSLLAVIFFVILAEGVFLAGSGFMPDWLDQFAQDIVFPAFSPTLLLFLAISSAYGVWKTRAGPEEEK